MIDIPRMATPKLVKGLTLLNSEGTIVVDRNALAMLAAVDGHASVDDLARIHGMTRTYDGLAKLIAIGSVRLDIRSIRIKSDSGRAQGRPAGQAHMTLGGTRPHARSPRRFPGEDGMIRTRRTASRVATAAPALIRRQLPLLAVASALPVVVLVALLVGRALVPDLIAGLRDVAMLATTPSATPIDEAPGADGSEIGHGGCEGAADCEGPARLATLPETSSPLMPAPNLAALQMTGETDGASPPEATAPSPISTSLPTPSLAVTPRSGMVRSGPSVSTAVPVAASPVVVAPPTSTVVPARPRILFEERFTDGPRGWPNDPTSTAWLGDGGYRLFARQPGQFVTVGVPGSPTLMHVTLTGVFRKVGGPPGGGYGLVVRDQRNGARDGVNQGGRYYVLEVGDRGEIGIWRRDEDRWVDLLSWTPSPSVHAGNATNELTVKVDSTELRFVVNGDEVARSNDAAFTGGAVGVFVGGDGNEVLLERLHAETTE